MYAGQIFVACFYQKHLMNKYYKNLMTLLLTNLKNEQAILAGLSNRLSDVLNTCGEECDSDNLKSENYDLLMQTLEIIHTITHSPQT